ncbi:MAG: alpha/beta hydrolase family protein [Pyrinomonadaceae bacterium]
MKNRLLALTILFSMLAYAGAAAVPPAVETIKFESKLVGAVLPYNVVLPPDYSLPTARNLRFPVLYLLHGLTGHYGDWVSKSKLTDYAARHRIIIVTPEGNNGWYTDSPVKESEKYESYIMQELIPDVERRFRTLSSREGRSIAGLSMGGYGALKLGMKHPDKFVFAGSMSGALGAAAWTDAVINTEPAKSSIMQAFGPADHAARPANDLFKMAAAITPERIAALPFLYVDCGNEDFLIQMNRSFVEALVKQKIPHEYRQLPGKHDWPYWDKQVCESVVEIYVC